MLLPDPRRLLADFLRTHRERVTPADAGLDPDKAGRRRTPGLRREELASLCGISTSWYTFLEQGREVSVSPAALSRLAKALRLTEAERAYLFELSGKRDPARREVEDDAPASTALMARAVEAIAAPAYLLDPLWDARAWNAGAARLFPDWLGGPDPSLLRFVFLSAAARRLIPDWSDRARRLVAEFRADTGGRRDDTRVVALLEALRRDSRAFAGFWDDHAVLGREGGERAFAHPDGGMLRFEQITLQPAGWPGFKLVLLLPCPLDAPGEAASRLP